MERERIIKVRQYLREAMRVERQFFGVVAWTGRLLWRLPRQLWGGTRRLLYLAAIVSISSMMSMMSMTSMTSTMSLGLSMGSVMGMGITGAVGSTETMGTIGSTGTVGTTGTVGSMGVLYGEVGNIKPGERIAPVLSVSSRFQWLLGTQRATETAYQSELALMTLGGGNRLAQGNNEAPNPNTEPAESTESVESAQAPESTESPEPAESTESAQVPEPAESTEVPESTEVVEPAESVEAAEVPSETNGSIVEESSDSAAKEPNEVSQTNEVVEEESSGASSGEQASNAEDSEKAQNAENAQDSQDSENAVSSEEAAKLEAPREETAAERVAREERETERLGTSPKETGVAIDSGGLTNVELFEPLLDTPLKRYNARTAGHIFWRTDALVFISIPFSFLWSTFLKTLLRNFSVLGGFFEGARTPVLNAVNFSYSHDSYPANTTDPLDVFTWANLGLWPLVVALNDIIDRTSVPKQYARTKQRMRNNRFYRDILFQNF